jgi:hypothetical protein
VSLTDLIAFDAAGAAPDGAWWARVAAVLAEDHGFALCFAQPDGDGVDWTELRDWASVGAGAAPVFTGRYLSCFFADRPRTGQARILCNLDVQERRAIHGPPYDCAGPIELGARLLRLDGLVDVQALYVADEPLDFYNAFIAAVTSATGGMHYDPRLHTLALADGSTVKAVGY